MADAINESDKYLSNGGSNYHANFAIPSKNLTVAGAANGNTVSGSQTGITKGTAYDITATPTTGYTFGGWSATSGSSSITIANSSSASTNVTFNNYSNNATVTASFNETMSTVTLSATPSGKGTFTIGGAAATSTSVGVTTTKSVTAVPASGYHFVSWSITGGASISSTTTNPTTVTGGGAGTAATLTATFAADDTYSLTVAAGTGISSVTGTTNNISAAQDIDITATVATGYTWNTWTKTGSGTLSTFTAGTKDQTVTVGTAGDMTLTASATENMTTVTINSSPTGVGAFTLDAAAFTAGNTTTAGVATSHTVVATAANSDYAFSSWTAAGNATGSNSTNTYTLRGNGSGSTGTLTANFTLVPCKLYKLSAAKNGEITDKGAMSYDTDENAYYMDVTTDAQPFYFRFYHNGATQYCSTWEDAYSGGYTKGLQVSANGSKVSSDQNVNGWDDKPAMYYNGVSGSQIRIWFDYQNKKAWITTTDSRWAVSGGDSGNADGSDAMGDWSANANKMNESATNTVSTTINITSSGNYYLKVTDRYTNTWYGKNSTTITRASNSASGLSSSDANITFTADVTGTYTFAYNTSTQTLTVTYPTETGYTVTTSASAGGTVDAASYTAYEFTTTAISATPNTGYYFTGWEATSGSVTFTNASSASTTINGVTAAATIKANFAPKWAIAGGDSQNADNGDDVMGNWSTTANLIANIGTNANSQDTGYVEINLPANTTFYFKVKDRTQDSDHGWYGNNGTMNYANNNKQAWDMATNVNNNCGITTAGAGTYKFAWNFTINKVTVHYPNSYTVTFDKGTGGSAVTASGSVSGSITSGQYVAEGEDITFTQTPASGYTFKGWYNASSGGTAIASMASDNVYDDIAGNANIYAQYTEDTYTVTLVADGAFGTAHVTGGAATSGSAGIATSLAITAEPVSGNRFIRWTQTGGTGTAVIANDRSASTTVTVTGGDVTLTAEMGSNWVIGGNADIFGNWNMANGHSFGNFEDNIGYVDIELPANTTYEVKVYDHGNSSWWGYTTDGMKTVDYTHNRGTALTFGMGGDYKNLQIVTAGHGTYRFTWNVTDKQLTVTYPTSYTVTYNTLTWKGTNGEVKEISTTGGSLTSVVDNDDLAFTSGKYVVATGSVTFIASPATNYSLEGWYSDESCETAYVNDEGGATISENTLTLSSFTADKTVYAKFAENMTTIAISHNAHGEVQLSSSPVTSITAGAVTTRSITAVPNEGYYFAGWSKTACTDYSISGSEDDEDNTTITLTGLGAGATSGETLTANFVALEKVYFRNWNEDNSEPLWENVYAYFSISYENDGEGKSCAKSNSSSDYSGILMTQEGSTNVYWAYVPRGTTRNSDDDIAFSNYNFGTNYKFNGYEAVKRGDYKTGWNMFVPQSSNNETLNGTKYYNGYWKHHNVAVGTDAGYRIERYNGSGYVDPADNGDGSEHHRDFTVTSENTIQYQLRVDNLTSGHNKYMIYNVGGTHYITFGENVEEAGYTLTNTDCSNIGLSEYNSGSPRFYITPTSEGIYTLTIDMTGDVMRLSVNYPVAVGDYMLVHSYNNGSAKTHYSDIIKSTEVSDRRYSMYIDNISTHSSSLVLKKCTSISAGGTPVWSAGNAVSMTGFTADTKGVYVFDVELNTSSDLATLKTIESYTGNYYIKTDCADGGWTAYTSNVMEENTISFDESDASTYDYYYCKWVTSSNTTNVKCVIANDYCIALSDTLEGDDILGGAQVLPYDANVRFSYNSVTNTVQRAYINGANDWQRSFLNISAGSEVIRGRYRNSWLNSTTYDSTFTDKNNWIYQVDLQAKPGARVKLTANYRYGNADHIQYFYGASGDYANANTEQIVGGTADEWFTMRAVYDFKTNKLLVGLLANGDTYSSEKTINADLLVVRGNQSSAQQLNFTESGSLAEVDTVYGILQFDKTFLGNNSKTVYERSLYWVSFPFNVNLKDVFGFGEYGTHWILEYYDGEARAREKFWAESDGFWKFVTPSMRDTGYILQANVGYVVGLDLDYFADTITYANTTWANGVRELSLYFPSNSRVGSINNASQEIQVPAHTCTTTRDNRHIWDSNWNIIGVPSYANITHLEEPSLNSLRNQLTGGLYSTDNLRFFYAWNPSSNALKLDAIASDSTFKTMYGYMTQYAGTITWSSSGGTLSAPRRDNAEQKEFYNIKLSVAQDGVDIDHTYIELRDDATETYDMNLDLVKAANAGMTDIYTLVDDVEMGGNCLPIANTVTIVPVGLRTVASTDYTFSLPNGSDGIEVTLIDYLNNTETNLSLGDYTTHIDKGTCNNRFALRLNRAKVVTAIEGAENGNLQTAGNEKVVIDGTLYIRQADGSVFDAQGKRVK
ncbi:MAG: InlB B-repeat-containing protein [Paludibacteraceae bacterium]|nr:InlB B-repeat-containing protein [Paludibacteraceae bacterium]